MKNHQSLSPPRHIDQSIIRRARGDEFHRLALRYSQRLCCIEVDRKNFFDKQIQITHDAYR